MTALEMLVSYRSGPSGPTLFFYLSRASKDMKDAGLAAANPASHRDVSLTHKVVPLRQRCNLHHVCGATALAVIILEMLMLG